MTCIEIIKRSLLYFLCSFGALTAADIATFQFQDYSVTCIQDSPARHQASLFSDYGQSSFHQTAKNYESSINVFLLKYHGEYYLIDAGNDQARGSLRNKLNKLKIDETAVKGVFITHIHPDHVGGLLWNGKPLFTNAKLFIAQEEFDAWRKDANRAKLAKYLKPYQQRMELFKFDSNLPAGLVPVKKAGHTPGHTVFFLQIPQGKQIAFVGDILHAVELQVPHPTFCARYDSDPKTAVQSRLDILKMDALFFGAHFPFPGCAEIIASNAQNTSFRYMPRSK
ncbi:MAG: MBL fold metallo-hydrolase [Victivallales bacterium]|nr:MBL fold metallo-hydrolase [Victivallales bacterium]